MWSGSAKIAANTGRWRLVNADIERWTTGFESLPCHNNRAVINGVAFKPMPKTERDKYE